MLKDTLKILRKERNLSQADLSAALNVSIGAVGNWETGNRYPDVSMLKKIADFFNVSIDYLVGNDSMKQPTISANTITLPVIGEIAAGYDEIALEDWTGETVEIPLSYLKGRAATEFFVLKVHGDSMYPLYHSGDRVLILRQNALSRSGEIGAVLYGGENATLKKIEYIEGQAWMTLIPINPNYPPLTIEGEDLNNCEIIGIPKLLIREIQ